ncbi:MAG TPA: ATP-dependent zinc protease [Polyangiaceae bacterium]|nr:ATP-dependent zinc protease [Polyangiaceae bacterium]
MLDDEAIVGWREWVALPDLGVGAIKAKVDTGARSSALHVFEPELFWRGGEEWLRFEVHPLQRDASVSVMTEARIHEFRHVRSSSGERSERPVIITNVQWNGHTWPVEMTLARRDEMGFRLLLGRQAVRGRFLVDAGNSFYGPMPPDASVRGKPKRRRS